MCTFLARCNKRAGLIGPDTNKQNRDGPCKHPGRGRGGGGDRGGGEQYLRKGDNIC